jgi:hypothetical protein
MTWPDNAWAFSKLLGVEPARLLASLLLVLAALGFITGGLGLFIRQGWWRPVAAGTAVFSAILFIILWDGKFQAWQDKGGIGILIDLAILVAVLLLKWPS